MDERLIFVDTVRGEFGWIIKATMNNNRFSREDRAGFIGMPTHCDDVVKFQVVQLFHGFALMRRNIHANLAHRHYSQGIQSTLFYSARPGFNRSLVMVPAESFCHLAAA
jgi:hypothetical protein